MKPTTVATVVGENAVMLVLPIDVANTLRRVCDYIAGDPDTTERGRTDEIGEALANAGITGICGGCISGGIEFESLTEAEAAA